MTRFFQERGVNPTLAEELQQQVLDALEGIKDFLHSV